MDNKDEELRKLIFLWRKYITLASQTKKRDGRLVNEAGKPYSKEYIAKVCMVTVQEVEDMEKEFSDSGQLKIKKDGTRVITKWQKYISMGVK